MYCTGTVIGLNDGFGLGWHGMAPWNGNGLNRPDFLSDGAYILVLTIDTVFN